MLQKHNTVVKTCRFCLTQPPRFTSLWIVKAGLPHSWTVRLQSVGRWLLACCFGLVLGACAAAGPPGSEDDAKVVAERAQKRWDLVAKGQADEAYQYLSPASRTTTSIERFRKQTSGGQYWRSMTLTEVDCREDTCRVTMSLEYDLREIKGLKATIEEIWIKDAGSWWLVAGR